MSSSAPEPHPDAPHPDAVCDGGDLDCGSGLLLIIRTAMAPLAGGGVLLVKSRETSVREDLPAWCRMVGHNIAATQAAPAGYTHYFLRKKAGDDALQRDLAAARAHTWQTRVRWSGGMLAKASMRNHSFQVGQPASFDTSDAAPSAIEYLLAAVGGALTTGLQWRLSSQGVAVHNLEVVVKARSANILTFLGVEDSEHPGLAAVEVVVYLDADADDATLDAALAETVRRCPVTQSLARGTRVDVQRKGV
jgi:uncharacterized OsmC-like protein/TusA-related sulfurtransferase